MREEALLFGKYQSLVGVVTDPDMPSSLPAVLLLNAGLIHHIGPNRFYVKLARHLAKIGFAVLRFDLSGIGDSKVRADNLPFEKSTIDDTQQAMDYLQETRGVNEFLLIGYCAGAVNSFMTAIADTRVIGVVMINPEGGDQQWDIYGYRRKTSRYYENYYYKTVLRDVERWKKLLTGRASYRSIIRNIFQKILWNKISTLTFNLKNRLIKSNNVVPEAARKMMVNSMETLIQRNTRLLLIFSEASVGLERIQALVGEELHRMGAVGKVKVEIIPQSDHTFTLLNTQQALFSILQDWCLAAAGERTYEHSLP